MLGKAEIVYPSDPRFRGFLDKVPVVVRMLLFGGERLSCCTHAAIVTYVDDVVAAATIAPEGQQQSGQPEVVAAYTLKAYRRQGHGRQALMAALDHLFRKEGIYRPVRLEIVSASGLALVNSLPEAYKVANDLHQGVEVVSVVMPGVDALLDL